ncbi:MAG: hypothetical protein HY398_00870 [Candidatus Doudnabacteria bacterium]|nr:hypothetical protein [Candidatus Doudnabacteria bacterium]
MNKFVIVMFLLFVVFVFLPPAVEHPELPSSSAISDDPGAPIPPTPQEAPLWVRDPRRFGYIMAVGVIIAMLGVALLMAWSGRRELRRMKRISPFI